MAKKPSKKSKHIKELEKIIAELDEASEKPETISITDEERARLTAQEERELRKHLGHMRASYDFKDMKTTFDVRTTTDEPRKITSELDATDITDLRNIVDKMLKRKP